VDAVSIVKGEGLRLGYRSRVLVRDLSFDINGGEILGIVGPNGCGKTTLVRTVLGLMPPLGGRVQRDPSVRMAYVPQRERLDTALPITALELVMMGRSAQFSVWRRTGKQDRDAARRALARVEAEALGPQLFRSLSGGQQRRVTLARALAAEPDVLVLDEPTAGMDLAGEAAIVDFLRELHRSHGVTILVVTHMLSLVLNLATTIMLMDAGTVVHGAVDTVVREDRLRALYGVPVHVARVAGQRVLVVGRPEAGDV
jgi:ABC-type Mn2+/Zn2+ transport system ATPase subunit